MESGVLSGLMKVTTESEVLSELMRELLIGMLSGLIITTESDVLSGLMRELLRGMLSGLMGNY